jgi:hypothetical protein
VILPPYSAAVLLNAPAGLQIEIQGEIDALYGAAEGRALTGLP